ncbi:MAG: Ig-like domain-containing protein [bacterium]
MSIRQILAILIIILVASIGLLLFLTTKSPSLNISEPQEGLITQAENNKISVSGNADKGNLVRIDVIIGDKKVNSVITTVDARQRFSKLVPLINQELFSSTGCEDIYEGSYTIRVQVKNSAGKSKTDERHIVIDKTPPVLMIVYPPSTEFKTDTEGIEFVGTTEKGAGLTAMINDKAQGVAVGDDGSFSCPITLSPGTNTISIESKDSAKNTNKTELQIFLTEKTEEEKQPAEKQLAEQALEAVQGCLDSVRTKGYFVHSEADEGLSMVRDLFNQGKYEAVIQGIEGIKKIIGTAEKKHNAISARIRNMEKEVKKHVKDSRASQEITTILSGASSDLGQGKYSLAEKGLTNAQRMIQKASDVRIEIDTKPPELKVSPLPAMTNKDTVVVEGVVSDNKKVVSLKAGNKEIPFSPKGNFSARINLQEGANEIVIAALDPSSNQSEQQVKIVKDATPPVIKITSPEPKNRVTNQDAVPISGRVEDAGSGIAIVEVNGNKVNFSNDGYFGTTISHLKQGKNIIKITAEDKANNIAKEEFEIIIDNTPPQAKISIPKNDIDIEKDSVEIIGRVTDDGVIKDIELLVDNKPVKIRLDAEGRFKQEIELRDIKKYTIVLAAVDSLGNKSIPDVVRVNRIKVELPPPPVVKPIAPVVISTPPVDKHTPPVVIPTPPVVDTTPPPSLPVAKPTPPVVITPSLPSDPISEKWNRVLKNIYDNEGYDQALVILKELEKKESTAFISFYEGLAHYKKARRLDSPVDTEQAIKEYNLSIKNLQEAFSRRAEFSRIQPPTGVSFNAPLRNIHDIRFYLAMSYYYIYVCYEQQPDSSENIQARWKNEANDAFNEYFSRFKDGSDPKSSWETAKRVYNQMNR